MYYDIESEKDHHALIISEVFTHTTTCKHPMIS